MVDTVSTHANHLSSDPGRLYFAHIGESALVFKND